MRQLLISISLALLIHAILLFGDFSRLQFFSAVSPELKTVNLTLIAYSPPEMEENPIVPVSAAPAAKAPEAIEDIEEHLLLPEPAMLPAQEVDDPGFDQQPQTSAPPAAEENQPLPSEPTMLPEAEAEEPLPSKPSVESLEPAAQADISVTEKEPVQVRRKPKRSLKALTKFIPKAAATNLPAARAKVIQRETFDKKDALSSSSFPTPRKNPQSPESKSDAAVSTESKSNRPLTSALKAAADTVASVDKRVPAPQIRLAKPLYRRNPPPDYPKRARRKGMEGIVILEILVDEKGGVEDITLFKSSGHKILDKAARASVKSWLFQPGTRDGQNIKMWVQVPIRFKLN